MERFKQLFNEDDLEGKVIKEVCFVDEKAIIHFYNNEFCILVCGGYDIRYLEIQDSKLGFETTSASHIFDLKNYGFMSEEEYNSLRKEFARKEAEKQERDERMLFERLKTKYQ
jgi:hypothetical protein